MKQKRKIKAIETVLELYKQNRIDKAESAYLISGIISIAGLKEVKEIIEVVKKNGK